MNDETTEDYYTRGLVAGHRRAIFLSASAMAESLETAEKLVAFYGELGMDRMEAYYTGIRDILGDVVEELAEASAYDPATEDLGLMWWERMLANVGWPVLVFIGFAILAVIFYWKAPDF